MDLREVLPALCSIDVSMFNGHLRTLKDEGKVHLERIGRTQWCWSFAGEDRHRREVEIMALNEELEDAHFAVQELQEKLRGADMSKAEERGRAELVERKKALDNEVPKLRQDLQKQMKRDPVQLHRRLKETEHFREAAEKWTRNISILEEWLEKAMDGRPETFEEMKKAVYGREYVEGAGLKRLED